MAETHYETSNGHSVGMVSAEMGTEDYRRRAQVAEFISENLSGEILNGGNTITVFSDSANLAKVYVAGNNLEFSPPEGWKVNSIEVKRACGNHEFNHTHIYMEREE